jgi:hypothetical protein
MSAAERIVSAFFLVFLRLAAIGRGRTVRGSSGFTGGSCNPASGPFARGGFLEVPFEV